MFILVLLLIIIIISFFVLALVFSDIKINIKEFDASNKENKITEFVFENIKIEVGIYLFKIFKILSIKVNREFVEFLKVKIPIQKIKEVEEKKIYKRLEILKNNYKKLNLKKIKPQFEKFELNLKVGTENATMTSFAVFAISSIITFILQLSVDKYTPKKYNYRIEPLYLNSNEVIMSFSSVITIKTYNLILFGKEYLNILKDKNNIAYIKIENRNIINSKGIRISKKYI